jgi:hypothetical protein
MERAFCFFVVTLLSARSVYRDNLPKQKLIADLNAAMALNNDAADTDFFCKTGRDEIFYQHAQTI